MEQFDCRACGACCVARGMPTMNHVDLAERDYMRLSPRTRKLHVRVTELVPLAHEPPRMQPHYRLRTINGGCCALLEGVVGERVTCSVYNQRPQMCREFKPGSADCQVFRRELGL